jgi:hypothetical protein
VGKPILGQKFPSKHGFAGLGRKWCVSYDFLFL